MDKPVEQTCAGCGTPLNDKTTCSCDPTICAKCCKCPDDCVCGCRDKQNEIEAA